MFTSYSTHRVGLMKDFRVLLIYSGSSIHRKINCQSKRPTCMFRAEKALNSKVSSLMLGIWGYTTCRLSSAILSSKGSNHPIKVAIAAIKTLFIDNLQFSFWMVQVLNSLAEKLPKHCKNPLNSGSIKHENCTVTTTLNITKQNLFEFQVFFFFFRILYPIDTWVQPIC